jgi:hypothetical protein
MLIIRIFLLFCGLLVFLPSQSQSITRSTLGSGGSTSFNNGILLRQTIGQSSGTEVLSNSDGILRQGFQQTIKHSSISFVSPVLVPAGDGFNLYPNPSKDFVHIEVSSNNETFDLYITNMHGKKVFQLQNLTPPYETINIQLLTPGVYFITIISGNAKATRKLIVL